MTKERKTQIATAIVLAGAVAFAVARKTAGRPTETPQDAIYGMLDAARSGDIKAYLACYTGQMQSAVKQSLAETGEPAFAKYLKDSQSAIKGVAVFDPQAVSDTESKVQVEYVYADRNETQTMWLEKSPAGWKISRADSDQRIPTLIPYGTPVTGR